MRVKQAWNTLIKVNYNVMTTPNVPAVGYSNAPFSRGRGD